MSRFPKLTETFVLDEILELESRGIRVEVFPLWRERATLVHESARPVVERAHYTPTLDLSILRDNLLQLWSSPRVYLGTLATLVWANRTSLRFLIAALAIFPKATSFARRMRLLGVQHVHAHFASHPAAAAFVVGRMGRLPWSFTAHGSDLHREQSMLAEKVAEARFVVAISEFNRDFILERVDPDMAGKVRVIHCGVEPEAFEVAGHPGHRFEFACVGTLHEVKGQSFLLEACGGLSKRGIDWRCHLVGDGPDRVALERRASELGISERVVFHGACERRAVRKVLQSVDAVVAPSVPTADGRREGIPVVLMEAAACGLPLVASRLSGIPEIVRDGETGILVRPGDALGIEAALARLAAEPETRKKLGQGARRVVEQEFRLTHNIDLLSQAFFPAQVPPTQVAPAKVPA